MIQSQICGCLNALKLRAPLIVALLAPCSWACWHLSSLRLEVNEMSIYFDLA